MPGASLGVFYPVPGPMACRPLGLHALLPKVQPTAPAGNVAHTRPAKNVRVAKPAPAGAALFALVLAASTAWAQAFYNSLGRKLARFIVGLVSALCLVSTVMGADR